MTAIVERKGGILIQRRELNKSSNSSPPFFLFFLTFFSFFGSFNSFGAEGSGCGRDPTSSSVLNGASSRTSSCFLRCLALLFSGSRPSSLAGGVSRSGGVACSADRWRPSSSPPLPPPTLPEESSSSSSSRDTATPRSSVPLPPPPPPPPPPPATASLTASRGTASPRTSTSPSCAAGRDMGSGSGSSSRARGARAAPACARTPRRTRPSWANCLSAVSWVKALCRSRVSLGFPPKEASRENKERDRKGRRYVLICPDVDDVSRPCGPLDNPV